MAYWGSLTLEKTWYRIPEKRRVAVKHQRDLASTHESKALLPWKGKPACHESHKVLLNVWENQHCNIHAPMWRQRLARALASQASPLLPGQPGWCWKPLLLAVAGASPGRPVVNSWRGVGS